MNVIVMPISFRSLHVTHSGARVTVWDSHHDTSSGTSAWHSSVVGGRGECYYVCAGDVYIG